MGRLERHASSGLATTAWHQINWAACYRQVRSLQRRLVQAVQAGVWRKVTRRSDLLVHACAGRAFAVKRVPENTGKQTPGVDGERWNTPAKNAAAVARLGRWRGDRPAPLKRLDIPKKNGAQRPLSIPTLADRARQAVDLPALPPMAETTGDQHAYGFRPKRRCADASDQGCKVLRQKTSATWSLEGDMAGFFENIRCLWMAEHIPMHTRVFATGRRSGCIDRGALFATTAGVPQGGMISPVVSKMVWDGLEAVVHGGSWHRRVHNINSGRWADDCLVTATSRPGLVDRVLPRINACLAERGVRLSPTKPVMPPIAQGFDCFGHTVRQYERPGGKPAKLQMTPSKASCQARKARVQALGQQAAGHTPARLIETLNPVLRGWANSHRQVIGGETFANLDNCVWRRRYRWARGRHPNTTGRWIAARYCPHQAGESWRCTAPVSGQPIIRVREAVKAQRSIKVQGDATPFAPAWEAYCQDRDRQLARRASSGFRAKILRQQDGRCPVCRQVIQREEDLELHHRDGHHQHHQLTNLVFLHPNCHRQVHAASGRTTDSLRPKGGVGHA
jgi:RNA-directed DNA polymerase